MAERRILTEDEALRLLAHFVATAELHTIEPPHYADRRILEGTLPLIDAMIRAGDPDTRDWLLAFKGDLQSALSARRTDEHAYERFLHAAPGRIARKIKGRGKDQRTGSREYGTMEEGPLL